MASTSWLPDQEAQRGLELRGGTSVCTELKETMEVHEARGPTELQVEVDGGGGGGV